MTAGPGLLCTDTVAERYAERLAAAAPGLSTIRLVGREPIGDDDLARVDAAFFSADAYPDRTDSLVQAAMGAAHLRWLHTFSAGTDHPVFGGVPCPRRADHDVVRCRRGTDRPHRDALRARP